MLARVQCSTDTLEQDLLKCLHHFAAKYYSEKGQLIDASRIARQKKRTRASADPGSRSSSWSTVDSISGGESDNGSVAIPTTSPITLQTSKKKGRQGADLVKDMYKMLDGSALVAVGRYSLMGIMPIIYCGIQGFSCMSTSNGLFDVTGPWGMRRILNRRD